MFSLRPAGRFGRFGQLLMLLAVWSVLNSLLVRLLLGRLLDAPVWLQTVVICLNAVTAVFSQIIKYTPKPKEPRIELAAGSITGSASSEVNFHDARDGIDSWSDSSS